MIQLYHILQKDTVKVKKVCDTYYILCVNRIYNCDSMSERRGETGAMIQ